MNAKSCCLIFAAGLLTAAIPGHAAQAQNPDAVTPPSQYSQPSNQNSNSPTAFPSNPQATGQGEGEAQNMVQANATFTKSIKSSSVQPGAACDVKLNTAVTLQNGTTLPKGTIINGQVVDDNSQPGSAHLAVQFTQARLANQTIPIKATIVGIFNTPSNGNSYDPWGGESLGTTPPKWNKSTLQIDQVNALPGIDLHSRIVGENSGVFVSNKKSDVKLGPSLSVALAIAPANQNNAMATPNESTNSAMNNLRHPAEPQR